MLTSHSACAVQIHKEEHEWVAGLAARSFAPWVGPLLAALRPQPTPSGGKQPVGSGIIVVRVGRPSIPVQCHSRCMNSVSPAHDISRCQEGQRPATAAHLERVAVVAAGLCRALCMILPQEPVRNLATYLRSGCVEAY